MKRVMAAANTMPITSTTQRILSHCALNDDIRAKISTGYAAQNATFAKTARMNRPSAKSNIEIRENQLILTTEPS